MERITNIVMTLLEIVIAGLFFNVGYLLQPEIGLINDPLYPESGLEGVTHSLFIAATMSIVVAVIMVTGTFWRNMAPRMSLVGLFALLAIASFD